jgi:ubiquinone/menaquinone biosynthesis C-methylase UbiE
MPSYDKKQTEILDPKKGYNIVYKQYKKHHKFLEDFDKNLWQRFLPRDLKNKTILDLGCGDGRISNFFV